MALRWAAHRARRAGRPPDRTGFVVRARSLRPRWAVRAEIPAEGRPLSPLRGVVAAARPHRPGARLGFAAPSVRGRTSAPRTTGPVALLGAAAPPATGRWDRGRDGRMKGGNRPAGRWCARRGRVGRAARTHRPCTSAGSGTPCRGARVAAGPAVPRARPARRCSPWCPPLRPQAARAQDGEPGRNGRTLRQARPSGPTHAKGPAPIIGAGPSGVLRNSCPRQRAGVLWGCWGAIPRAVVYLARASLPIAG